MVAIESGVMTLQTQNCDLYHMLRDIEDTADDRTPNKDVKCVFEQSAELPQYIRIDAYKLQHILRHSLDLAAKSTKQGSVTFKAGLMPPEQIDSESGDGAVGDSDASRMMLQFTIRYGDDGMSPDDLTEEHDALGQALSRRFVELLHGQMTVESQDNGGFALHLTIPAESGEVRPSKAALVEKRQIIRLAPNDPPYRIIVAHRDTYSRQLLQRLLQSIGFSVQDALNEESVIEVAEQWQPHLICLDMHMPGMDASAVVGVIRAKHYTDASPETSSVAPKVFGLTVGRAPEEQERALAAGCDDILSTPFREPEIFGKIAAYLDVNYVYDTKTSQARQAGAAKMKRLTASQVPEHLATLPGEILHSLEVAAAQLNPFKLSMAVETIWLHDASLADNLESLAYQNNYKQLSSFVEKTAAIVGREA
jgi:CheY-like chemotaxis protein